MQNLGTIIRYKEPSVEGVHTFADLDEFLDFVDFQYESQLDMYSGIGLSELNEIELISSLKTANRIVEDLRKSGIDVDVTQMEGREKGVIIGLPRFQLKLIKL
jgi:hypothetical protein